MAATYQSMIAAVVMPRAIRVMLLQRSPSSKVLIAVVTEKMGPRIDLVLEQIVIALEIALAAITVGHWKQQDSRSLRLGYVREYNCENKSSSVLEGGEESKVNVASVSR